MMLANQAAKQADVHVETLRFYERKGLLQAPKRLASGYRAYDAETVQRIRFIKRLQHLGFTLAEIEVLLQLSAHEQTTCGAVQAQTIQKITEVEAKLRDLLTIKTALTGLLNDCRGSSHDRACQLLSALALSE